MRIKDKSTIIASAVAILFFAVPMLIPRPKPKAPIFDGTPLRGIIDLGRLADTSKALLTGYNYYLLEKYAKSHGQLIDIRLAEKDGAGLDSLRAGVVDMVVVPYIDTLERDSVLVSIPVDSMSVWLMSEQHDSRMEDFNRWVDAYHKSEEFEPTREKFLHVYSPYRSGRRNCLSPYDSLMKVHADSLGWDWRMFAAIIWEESRFHIEVRSRRGAFGLMQMMPGTAANFGIDNPLDPEQNIMAGAHYLRNLQNRFIHYGDNMTERYKYVLAAYNAGEGRIQDCIRYALYHNVDISYWQNIVNIIPKMNEPEPEEMELLRFGAFKGRETITYVEEVVNVYNNFCRICPE